MGNRDVSNGVEHDDYLRKLPEQIQTKILSHLDIATLTRFSLASKYVKRLCCNSIYWESEYSKHFPASYTLIKYLSERNAANPTRNWRNEFIRKFTEKRCELCGLVYNYFNNFHHSHSTTKKTTDKTNFPNKRDSILTKHQNSHHPASKEEVLFSSSSDAPTPQGSTSMHSGSIDFEVSEIPAPNGIDDYVYKRKSKYKKTETPAKTKRNLFANNTNL